LGNVALVVWGRSVAAAANEFLTGDLNASFALIRGASSLGFSVGPDAVAGLTTFGAAAYFDSSFGSEGG
jgi:hypothetical protein